MRKILTLLSFLAIGATTLSAQQDAMFTKYMFNSLVYNPAYAGYYDHMYISALYRNQWLGVDGAPTTQTLTLHTPLKNNRVGVGFHLLNQVLGRFVGRSTDRKSRKVSGPQTDPSHHRSQRGSP